MVATIDKFQKSMLEIYKPYWNLLHSFNVILNEFNKQNFESTFEFEKRNLSRYEVTKQHYCLFCYIILSSICFLRLALELILICLTVQSSILFWSYRPRFMVGAFQSKVTATDKRVVGFCRTFQSKVSATEKRVVGRGVLQSLLYSDVQISQNNMN